MLLTQSILDKVSEEAKVSPRLRKNFNLHKSTEELVQRMFNAMEPGTVVPVHRNQTASETIIVLRGKLRLILFNDDGEITEDYILQNNSEQFGYHVETSVWHSVECLETGTIIFEVKEGPYEPLTDEDILKMK